MPSQHHIPVQKTARYYTLGQIGPEITDVWFACHGYGQLASDFAAEFECIEAPERLIVVPEALSRFYVPAGPGLHGPDAKVGATWMTREDRESEIADYVSYLDEHSPWFLARRSNGAALAHARQSKRRQTAVVGITAGERCRSRSGSHAF